MCFKHIAESTVIVEQSCCHDVKNHHKGITGYWLYTYYNSYSCVD